MSWNVDLFWGSINLLRFCLCYLSIMFPSAQILKVTRVHDSTYVSSYVPSRSCSISSMSHPSGTRWSPKPSSNLDPPIAHV